MVIFWTFSFLGNIGQENVFYDILERTNAFLGYKIKKFKSRKIDIFAKGWNNISKFIMPKTKEGRIFYFLSKIMGQPSWKKSSFTIMFR